jgi:hypothetical protein
MPLPKPKVFDACWDEKVVHDKTDRAALLVFAENLPDEIASLRANADNADIVAYLRAKMGGGGV